ncbi:MAG TPA: iron-containing redox enzyme family protein [Edaphobacter sp.]|nr:iron-containing redox enzyme family protein [Edaphobacter sp.]
MPSATHSELLWTKIRFAEGRLLSASNLFWTHPDLARILPHFLIQLHRVMQNGISLMRTAKDCALLLPNDAVAARTAAYLEMHINEEKDHDQWLLSDIESLGIDSSEVLHATPLPAVVSLLGAQYFWMFHMHPVTIFGYLIVLEGYPPLVHQLEQIKRTTGLPASAFRCLISHAEDDPEHIDTLNRTLDNMPLTPNQSKYLALSAFHTIDSVASVLEELLEIHAASPLPEVSLPSYA